MGGSLRRRRAVPRAGLSLAPVTAPLRLDHSRRAWSSSTSGMPIALRRATFLEADWAPGQGGTRPLGRPGWNTRRRVPRRGLGQTCTFVRVSRPVAALIAAISAASSARPASAGMPQEIPSRPVRGQADPEVPLRPGEDHPRRELDRVRGTNLKPDVPGYITRFTPNLERARRLDPAGRRAAPAPRRVAHREELPDVRGGEEKTIYQLPQGYGYKYDPPDPWTVNHMIHNLPRPTRTRRT